MDKSTKKGQTETLIGIGLAELHQESREWIDSVEFWKDEVRFFEGILRKKTKIESKELEFKALLENMGKVHDNLFTYLMEEIYAHEKVLSRLQKKEQGIADADYRDKHNELKGKMILFEKDFKEFKKMVFGYVKKL